MRKTVLAASAAAVLALSAACGTDDENGNGVEETDPVATDVEQEDPTAEPTDAQDDALTDDAEPAEVEMTMLTLEDGSEVEVPNGIAMKYEEVQATTPLGAPVGELEEVATGFVMEFEEGAIFQGPDGNAFLVQGAILDEYMASGGPEGDLGFPTSDEMAEEAGFMSAFENGTIMFDGEQTIVEMN